MSGDFVEDCCLTRQDLNTHSYTSNQLDTLKLLYRIKAVDPAQMRADQVQQGVEVGREWFNSYTGDPQALKEITQKRRHSNKYLQHHAEHERT